MSRLKPFRLEDFFDKYEHRNDLVNLASSDAQPWASGQIEEGSPIFKDLGYPDLRGQLLPFLERALGVSGGVSVLPTAGAAEAIALVMHWLAAQDLGKAVAIPRPCYGAFEGLASLLSLKTCPYYYRRASQWSLDTSDLFKAVEECDVLVVANPHNPTGHVIGLSELRECANLLARKGGLLIVDEVFHTIGAKESVVGLGDNVVVISSLSKMYGLPGLRLGWVHGRANLVRDLRTIQQHLSLSLTAAAASMAIPILQNLHRYSRGALVQGNRAVITDWAKKNAEFARISAPAGGTTVIFEVMGDKSETSIFDAFLDAGVLLAPGSCFEAEPGGPWFRLCYGASPDRLQRGLNAVSATLEQLAKFP